MCVLLHAILCTVRSTLGCPIFLVRTALIGALERLFFPIIAAFLLSTISAPVVRVILGSILHTLLFAAQEDLPHSWLQELSSRDGTFERPRA